jgi:hypothetical protein
VAATSPPAGTMLACCNYEIWGLTGRMLKGFLDLVWQAV